MTSVRVGFAEVLSDPVIGDGGWTTPATPQTVWNPRAHAGCPVCGDPTGIRCCEHGADR